MELTCTLNYIYEHCSTNVKKFLTDKSAIDIYPENFRLLYSIAQNKRTQRNNPYLMTDAVLSAIIEFSTERLDCNNVNELSILFCEHKDLSIYICDLIKNIFTDLYHDTDYNILVTTALKSYIRFAELQAYKDIMLDKHLFKNEISEDEHLKYGLPKHFPSFDEAFYAAISHVYFTSKHIETSCYDFINATKSFKKLSKHLTEFIKSNIIPAIEKYNRTEAIDGNAIYSTFKNNYSNFICLINEKRKYDDNGRTLEYFYQRIVYDMEYITNISKLQNDFLPLSI